jgi:hypothetical protein
LQVLLPVQVEHCAPPFPQRCFVVLPSVMHWLLKQHPSQLPGPQAGGSWQVRSFGRPSATHSRGGVCPWQFWQAKPPFPHAVSSEPVSHCVPKQQPPPQLSGPHVGLPVHPPPPPKIAVHVWPLLAQF